jgi:hypothetical protein
MRNTDFDFLAGSWVSTQRRLATVLSNCDEWYEFPATLDCQVLLDGNGVFDVLRAPERDIEGLTLRLYHPEERAWRIWWASKSSGGVLDAPVVGSFTGPIGVFECDDVYQGTAVRVRYTWDKTDSDHPRWQQSFSADGGRTWEPNWEATLNRR